MSGGSYVQGWTRRKGRWHALPRYFAIGQPSSTGRDRQPRKALMWYISSSKKSGVMMLTLCHRHPVFWRSQWGQPFWCFDRFALANSCRITHVPWGGLTMAATVLPCYCCPILPTVPSDLNGMIDETLWRYYVNEAREWSTRSCWIYFVLLYR